VSASSPDTKAGNLVADTSAVISLFRGHDKARQSFNAANEVWLPVTALAELYCGLRKCSQPEKERQRVEALRSRVKVVGNDEETARHYAEIFTDLEAKGTPIPSNDVWIAALAMRHGLRLLAKDAHFRRVDGLDLVDLIEA
jgi:tRNA(fMet)-specific endonuclease VapC